MKIDRMDTKVNVTINLNSLNHENKTSLKPTESKRNSRIAGMIRFMLIWIGIKV